MCHTATGHELHGAQNGLRLRQLLFSVDSATENVSLIKCHRIVTLYSRVLLEIVLFLVGFYK